MFCLYETMNEIACDCFVFMKDRLRMFLFRRFQCVGSNHPPPPAIKTKKAKFNLFFWGRSVRSYEK